MRILTASLKQETNTFRLSPTGLEAFGRRPPGPALPGGEAVIRAFSGTATVLGGCLDRAAELGLSIEPVCRVEAPTGGRVEAAAFDELAALLVHRIAEQEAWDALILELHGTMATTTCHDGDGELVARLRAALGAEPLLVAVVDFHANLSPRLASLCDALVSYDRYPHADRRERGREAVDLAWKCFRERRKPYVAFRKVPLLTLAPAQATHREPLQSLLQQVWAVEQRPGIWSASLTPGFALADVPHAGASVVVCGDDAASAEPAAGELAAALWDARAAFETDLVPLEAVLRYARRAVGGTILLADGSDNPDGGGTGDETEILEALLEADVQGAVIASITDPETAWQAHDAGVGATITAQLGGKSPDSQTPSVQAEAYVKHLSDGRFIYRAALNEGLAGFLGHSAVLVIGGITVLVTSEPVQPIDPVILRSLGVEPTEARLLVLKSTVQFRTAFEPLTTQIFDVDTSGHYRPAWAGREYQHLRRPIYPLDPEMTWPVE